jgi:hypothetical protein
MASFIDTPDAQTHRNTKIYQKLEDRTGRIDDANNRNTSENLDVLDEIDRIIKDMKSAITESVDDMKADNKCFIRNLQ